MNIKPKKVHVSVLKEDVGRCLNVEENDVVIDATLGLGGHAKDILEKSGEKGILITFELDERNLEEAKKRLKVYEKQIIYIHDNFRYLKTGVTGRGVEEIDAILFDLGLSSPHVDDADRGFSFMKEGPLDMRYDSRNDLTAYDVVNSYSEEDLSRIFFEYGEERMAKKAAREICHCRNEQKFDSTIELAEFLEKILKKKHSKRGSKLHPATKIFQAIRIEVNDELNALSEALEQAMELLKVGGRIVVISYHSLEDRIVKRFFKKLEQPPARPEDQVYRNYDEPIVEKLTKKPVIPGEQEQAENPRSRSAKLRAYKKIRQP